MESFKSYLMLLEGFKEVKKKWMDEGYSEYAVDEQIRIFKELVYKNQIPHPTNDIGYWSDATFAGFGRMVDDAKKKYEQSRALKKKANSKEYPILYENDKCIVYNILSKAASCRLGSDTPWCITKENQNYYEWHINHGYEIIFIISKAFDDEYWADEEGWQRENKWAFIRNDWKWSIWNKDNKSSFNNGMMGELNEVCSILDIDEDTQRDLFDTSGMEETPDYEVPMDEDDDGEWNDEYPTEEDEEEAVANDYFYDASTGTDWEPAEFHEDGFDEYVENHKEYFQLFIMNYFLNKIVDDAYAKDKIRVLMDADHDENYLKAFTESDYYQEYYRLMLEEIRDFLLEEMEGEIEVHPNTVHNRNLEDFVRARMSMFRTEPDLVIPK